MSENDTKFCIKCGKSIQKNAEFCPFCGTSQNDLNTGKNTNVHDNKKESLFQSVGKFYKSTIISFGTMSRRTFWQSWLFNMILAIFISIGFAIINYWGSKPVPYYTIAELHRIQNTYSFTYQTYLIIVSLFYLVQTVATITASVQRLHDINKSGWNYLFVLIPIFGWIYLIGLFVSPGTLQKYGENKLETI